jgi:O-antigen biosynthesis protein
VLVRKARVFVRLVRTTGLRSAVLVAVRTARTSTAFWKWRVEGLFRAFRTDGAPKVPPSALRISVVVPVYNTPPVVLESCIRSVLAQRHTEWELCMCDDGSQLAGTRAVLQKYVGSDPRIRIVTSDRNLGISGATNLAAEQATGVMLAFLDHDDVLHAEALAEIAHAVDESPDIDLLYTDEDKLEADGRHSEPYYKPDWSPEHLGSVMYMLHCLVVRKALFWKLGGSRCEFSGAQDYDLALRASAVARRIHHIPKVLYHWRKIPNSAAAVVDAKPAALAAAGRALEDAVARLDPPARVVPGLLPGTFRVRRPIAAGTPVTLVIPTRDAIVQIERRGRVALLRNFISSIVEKSTYRDFRILVVDNGGLSPETQELLRSVGARSVSFRVEGPFNYAQKANFALSHVETEHFVLLNDDLEVIAPDWIEALLEFSQVPGIGVVGARLLYPDRRLQHAGMVCGVNGTVAHAFVGLPADAVGYNGFTHLIRDYSCVTGAVLASRRDVLSNVGPFDTRFASDFNDVDFCLRARARGYRVVYTPFSELYHFEGASLVRRTQDPTEVALFTDLWADVIARDPYYNPNLPRDRTDFRTSYR